LLPTTRGKKLGACSIAILVKGVDQVAIACAFVTGAGVALLKRHLNHLRLPNSFLVAAWERPTDPAALASLHTEAPGNVYIHLGDKTPVEKQVGRGLMHSKVFFARSGRDCWMWVGSHNLTANAASGVNLEAAAIIEGTIDDKPLRDSLAHLEACRNEAVLFDPLNLPPISSPEATLVVHAEQHVKSLRRLPWHIHLRPSITDYDDIMAPPAPIWLYLYPIGSLASGTPRPRPQRVVSGRITALNFTEHHPERGIPADWQAANYVIEERRGVLQPSGRAPYTTTPTQCVFRINSDEDPDTLWFSKSPEPREERVLVS
jgi:hypothetical protein